jgi:hypothetical protein
MSRVGFPSALHESKEKRREKKRGRISPDNDILFLP